MFGSLASPSEGVSGAGAIAADGGGSSGPLRPQPPSATAAASAANAASRSADRLSKRIKNPTPQCAPFIADRPPDANANRGPVPQPSVLEICKRFQLVGFMAGTSPC